MQKADIARILSSDEVLEENNKQDVLALATALLADEDLFFNSYNRSLELHKHIFHEIVQVGYVKSFSYNIHLLIQILTGLRTTAYLNNVWSSPQLNLWGLRMDGKGRIFKKKRNSD